MRARLLVALLLATSITHSQIDPVTNFARGTVTQGYDASATSILLSVGHGARFPSTSGGKAFNLIWWNATDYGNPTDDPNREIIRCTLRSGDTLKTIVRAQEGTSASTKNTPAKTYLVILSITAKMFTDIQTTINQVVNDTVQAHAVPVNVSQGTGTGSVAYFAKDSSLKTMPTPSFGQTYWRSNTWHSNATGMAATTTQANTTNRLRAFPWILTKKISIDSIGYECSTAGANAATTLLLYNDSSVARAAAPPYPMTQLIIGGRDTNSAGIKWVSNSATPDTLSPGIYWWVVASRGTATLRAINQSNIPEILGFNIALGANSQFTCYDIARTYDQFVPTPFPSGAAQVANISPPLVIIHLNMAD